MGNTCTCFDENKDKGEFKTTESQNLLKEQEVIKIQASYRGYQARKDYKEQKSQEIDISEYGSTAPLSAE